MAHNVRPFIAITMGDAAGIGPEIIVKALTKKEIYEVCRPLIVGNTAVLRQAMKITDAHLSLYEVSHPEEGKYEFGTIDVITRNNIPLDRLRIGEVQASCGKAAYEYIQYAVKLANEGKVDALATAPINKESLREARVPYIGHTEMLGGLTGVEDPLTMFEVKSLRIFFLTRHVSLRQAIEQINADRIRDYLSRCNRALKRLGMKNCRLAVAGLNPHSGEQGLFGREEIDEIIPGIERARRDGIDVVGPVPADSVFYQALNGRYDAVLSLYHDQGHIAAKMTDFERTISITNELPFLRTSVDHGTAFDIAGTGKASAVSMEECIKLAAQYASKFRRVVNV